MKKIVRSIVLSTFVCAISLNNMHFYAFAQDTNSEIKNRVALNYPILLWIVVEIKVYLLGNSKFIWE